MRVRRKSRNTNGTHELNTRSNFVKQKSQNDDGRSFDQNELNLGYWRVRRSYGNG